MICEHCGTLNEELIEARAEASMWHIKYDASEEERDALKSQLESMTKRAEEAELEVEALVTDTQDEARNGEWHTKAKVAEAKLATAVETLKWYRNNNTQPGRARETLRALGIDPSKEQGK